MNHHGSQEHIISGRCNPLEKSPPGVTRRTCVSSVCGARNFYTGTATFEPGAALRPHAHKVSEAVTVLKGKAIILVIAASRKRMKFLQTHVVYLQRQ